MGRDRAERGLSRLGVARAKGHNSTDEARRLLLTGG